MPWVSSSSLRPGAARTRADRARARWSCDTTCWSSAPSAAQDRPSSPASSAVRSATKAAGTRRVHRLPFTCRRGGVVQPRNPQQQRERDRRGRRDLDPDGVAERVVGVFRDRDGDVACHDGADLARCIGHGREAAVRRQHPQALHQLRPSLVHVGRAAAEVGLEAEQVRLGSVATPSARRQLHKHLVGLLVGTGATTCRPRAWPAAR